MNFLPSPGFVDFSSVECLRCKTVYALQFTIFTNAQITAVYILQRCTCYNDMFLNITCMGNYDGETTALYILPTISC